jgi:2-deoxy-D-gluconate 3-dehydrogenase
MTGILDRFNLSGRVAIVTGGAGLLGREFSLALAEAGASVAVADLDSSRAASAAESLQAAGLRAKALAVDVSDKAAIARMVDAILGEWGRIDVLVNSAALDPKVEAGGSAALSDAFEDLSLETWNRALAVNLTGPFLCAQAVCRSMLAQGSGSIVNIASTYGLVGPDQRIYPRVDGRPQVKPAHYSVAKAGIIGLTKYLAAYFAGSNLRVNALTPGGVGQDQPPEFVRRYSDRAVMGRMARRDELNGALLFLASDASSYMTGANLVVDGGWTAW